MSPQSISELSHLPDVGGLRSLFQSLAMLDALLSRQWERRRYLYNAHWGVDVQLATVRATGPDNLIAWFQPHGCLLKGFVHDSPLAHVGLRGKLLFQNLPAEFASCAKEPGLTVAQTTFCLWRKNSDPHWTAQRLPDDVLNDPPVKQALTSADSDGAQSALEFLSRDHETLGKRAEAHFGRTWPAESGRAIFERQPLTEALVRTFDPTRTLRSLRDDIREIGYPA